MKLCVKGWNLFNFEYSLITHLFDFICFLDYDENCKLWLGLFGYDLSCSEY